MAAPIRARFEAMKTGFMTILGLLLGVSLAKAQSAAPEVPSYTDDGRLALPVDYRTWVYLSSGFDMSYNPQMRMGHHMFDNVFVQPEAYEAFIQTGTWPEKTMLVLESRGAQDRGSINKVGNYQSEEVMGIEIHVKDTAHFPDSWAFFAFDGAKPSAMIPRSVDCYACHKDHAAVDNTFVQFYPTLLPIARSKGTLSKSYLRDLSDAQK
jgi:hypothetical protein